MTRFAPVRRACSNGRQIGVEELAFVDAHDLGLGGDLAKIARGRHGFRDGIRMSLWDVMWSSPYRLSIFGLKICTLCRAICARRSRRMSSSLFPLNMLPVITSIQPVLG